MLVRHNVRGLRLAVLSALAFVFLACSSSGSGGGPSSSGEPAAPNVASTKAADLRTRLDLLLGEQVMIIAKESAAAVNHTDDYAGYTALLTTNSNDLADMMRRAFGATTAARFSQQWNLQNGYFVDYAIGVVSHNDTKSSGAIASLKTDFVPQFSQLMSDASRLPLDPVTQLTTQQMLQNKAFIDDAFAQKFGAFYTDLHTAYAQTSRLGDALAGQIAHEFPDKFPGDPEAHAVDVRVSLNLLLQEHSYLATMATSAVAAGRTAEKPASTAGLASNANMLGTLFATSFGNAAGTQFDRVWSARDAALIGYASGDAASKSALTETFVAAFASLAHVNQTPVASQVDATIKVIDEQRAKSLKTIAGDDRMAAGSMQPLADSIQG